MTNRLPLFFVALALGVVLGGCATPTLPARQAMDVNASAWGLASGLRQDGQVTAPTPASHWSPFLLPGKRASEYLPAQIDDRAALAVHAPSSASMLRRQVQVAPSTLGLLRFSWKVPDLIASADMGNKDLDDAPVRIALAFDGDRSSFSARNAMLSELTHALTGEPMPYAVLMYVWSKHRPVGSIIHSPRTDRIRKLVVESGPHRLNQWLVFERDVRADFAQVFNEAPGPLVALGVMTDTDNTRSTIDAWYGPLQLELRVP